MAWLRIQLTEEEQRVVDENDPSIPTRESGRRCSCSGCYITAYAQNAAKIVGASHHSFSGTSPRFGGRIGGLRQWNPNRPVSEMAAYRDMIRESFEKQPVCTVAEACECIFQLTGLRRSPSQVRKFLKDMGLKSCGFARSPCRPKKLGRAHRNPGSFSQQPTEAAIGCRSSRRRPCVLRRCGPFRVRHVLMLSLVVSADIRACGVGPSAVQRTGCVECGDA